MDKEYYFKILYPLQDEILNIINNMKTGFYLTGGTASSRGYLNHRFSDDLDFFVNDNPQFNLWIERIINTFTTHRDWELSILQKDERFVRISLSTRKTILKIEFINDVPSHIGEIKYHKVLGKIDSTENILANKITAVIDRQEPKDIADIWGFCCKMGLSLTTAITDAHSKAAGIFPPDIARVLCSVTTSDWKVIRWIDRPECSRFINELQRLGDSLIILDR